ncbi:MerR family transcriptional regulator [Mycolicibacterium sp. 120266]|uniref:MerR family transcriptional regulator n=1 Tax=Mycolicibacterium sp. 120266 TaxID=3090601 RepID=UPI00299E8F44|nr:MerR family transcriptional regulator [Mycolicibacterium sp. 120266]MDX1872514.1 MerR family transcriptional regulator [Mycolicibacterium sp. 120266]
MSWSIQQVARMSGVTARTLRHYDDIGLLPPSEVGANGYRYYDRRQLLRLQHILLLRELGVDLTTIRAVVDERRDPVEMLRTHHQRLLDERERLGRLAHTVTLTIGNIEHGDEMPAESLFAAMTPERAAYLTDLPKKRIAAGALFCDDQNRTLLVKPTYKNYWQLPGGVAEADEAPLAAATRRVRQELGLPAAILGRLLVVDWVAPRDAVAIEGLLFVYDAPALSDEQIAAITLPADELADWSWCDEQQLHERLPAHMLRRIVSARSARKEGKTCYLENGATCS